MHDDIVRILYQLANKKPVSDEDNRLLEQWISQSKYNKELYQEVLNADAFREEVKASLDYDSKPLWKKISRRLFPKKNNLASVFRNPFLRIAAVAILVVAIGGYFLLIKDPQKEITSTANSESKPVNDIAPGTDKATLALADGSVITLDNSRNGTIINQEGTTVTNQGAQLEYNNAGKQDDIDHAVSYHTLSTPRGGQYQLLLPDGSKVFLNAYSSIRFPTAFIGKERLVEISGEAYFEVKHNTALPFKVKINTPVGDGGEVAVLGTHFNINAYADEATISTTLIEGKVKISKDSRTISLKPGQQAQLVNYDQLRLVEDADVEAAVAWKNGLFSFNGSNIKTVMQNIIRWYDVDVVYAGEVKETFFVKMSRNTNVSNVFKILETTGGVHFNIEGKKIIVRP